MAARASYVNGPGEEGVIHTLQDFVSIADLPTTVSVVGGSYRDTGVQLHTGDVLLLRSHLPKEVHLSYHSEDTGVKKEAFMSLDSSLKFVILPPKNKGQFCDDRPESLYPSVRDLLKDCPTYFQATQDYDEPYLPGFSVRQGEKFRFMRTFKDPRDNKSRLECKDHGGSTIYLSSDCKGYFRVLEDRTTYTLQELVNQARVSRRLRLSTDNVQLQPVPTKRSHEAGTDPDKPTLVSPISGIPFTFKGIIHLRKPEEMMEVSPWGDLENRWKIPVTANLKVRQFSQSDYEVPVRHKLVSLNTEEFIERHKDEFPILATIVNYPNMHSDLANHLKNVSDVIVHKVKSSKRLLARTRARYFSIDGNVRASFSEFPKSFKTIQDLLRCSAGTEVRVMEDIFSDFPRPFCLRYGDILRLVSIEPEVYKMKKCSIKECEVVRFQRIGDKGYCIPIMLPSDLELRTMEMTNYHHHRPHLLSDIISGAELPSRTVTVLQEASESSLPLPGRFRLMAVATEDVLVISPVEYGETLAISPILETCIEIPTRHAVYFAYNRRLEFPGGYFVFPRPQHIVAIRVEKITEQLSNKMRATSDVYEEVGHNRPVRSLSTGAIDRVKKRKRNPLRRLSAALNPVNWRRSRTPTVLNRLSREPSTPTNDYQTSPRSPRPHSKIDDDPYEQINVEIGASLASANRTYSQPDMQSLILPRRIEQRRTTAI